MSETREVGSNRAAAMACVLGVAGLVSSPVIVGGLIGLVAIVVGVFAVRTPMKRGLAITGIACGGAAMPLALAFGVMLFVMPVMRHARERAQRVRTMGNMSRILRACQIYQADYAVMPPHLAVLVAEHEVTPEMLLETGSAEARIAVPASGVPWESLVPTVDAHTDFVYVGAGVQLLRVKSPENFIILSTKKGRGATRLVAYADGHVEMWPEAQLHTAVEFTDGERAEQNLPPLPPDLSEAPATTLPAVDVEQK